MRLEELEADDAAIARMQARDEADPRFKAAWRARLAHEREQDRRLDAMWPAQHPFEYDPKRPSLHP